jgi:hypothetical protein
LLLAWVVRGTGRSFRIGDSIFLHRVDVEAFRNLLSSANAEYLRNSLSKSNYRRIQRSQVRAFQEYVYWIAEDCAAILALTRKDTQRSTIQAAAISRRAIRLRMIALTYWVLICVKYLIPGETLGPSGLTRSYEELRRGAEAFLVGYRIQAASAS